MALFSKKEKITQPATTPTLKPTPKVQAPVVKGHRNSTFICQISDLNLKVIKCAVGRGQQKEFVGLEMDSLTPDIDDKKLSEKISSCLKKLDYSGNPVIVCLPRSRVTCRFLKVPATAPEEIEEIVSLQASRYLPYPAEELITGHQVIATDKEGYSEVNLVIMHKSAVERYVKIFKELKASKLFITLSSYGLVNFYDYAAAGDSGVNMVIDVDASQIELGVVLNKKLVFSRYFKIDKANPNLESALVDEINKSRDAYLKEVAKEAPAKIFVIGAGKDYQTIAGLLSKQGNLNVGTLFYDKIVASDDFRSKAFNSENSFVNAIGLGLKDIEESLNFLPRTIKTDALRVVKQKEWIKTGALIVGVILVTSLAITKTLDNKAMYLKQLKTQLNKIASEANALEQIDKRFKFMESALQKKPSSLEVLSELYKVVPNKVYLVHFSYAEGKDIVLRGQAPELNPVLDFVSALEKSVVFKEFKTKIKYATKKVAANSEIINFEIDCVR